MTSLLHHITSSSSVKFSLSSDGALTITNEQALTPKQSEWLLQNHDELHRELITTNLQQLIYPDQFGKLLYKYNNVEDFLDELANIATSNGGLWVYVLNSLLWWLSLCVNDKTMTINQLRAELEFLPRFLATEHAIDERKWFLSKLAILSDKKIREATSRYNFVFDEVFKAHEHQPIKRENLARRAANKALRELIERYNQRVVNINQIRAMLGNN